jgi:mannonate dehydratase
MIKISVWCREFSERYLRGVTQLGADCLDFPSADYFPGTEEQGYPDLQQLLQLKERIRSYGLRINRVTLPTIGEAFMQGRSGGDVDLENAIQALQVYGEAGLPLVRQRFAGDVFPQMTVRYQARHRGGYMARGESAGLIRAFPEMPTAQDLENWWERFCMVYSELVPVAERYGIKLAIHPSDTPNPDTPLGGLGMHRVIDAFPSENVGLLYCIGTRAEAGGSALVLDEINHYGRKGRLFMCHFRNVRGSLATAGGFEEVLLDDGDMNMYRILQALQRVGFDGCLNPDHIPPLEGDGPGASLGLAYSIGYIKALLAASMA